MQPAVNENAIAMMQVDSAQEEAHSLLGSMEPVKAWISSLTGHSNSLKDDNGSPTIGLPVASFLRFLYFMPVGSLPKHISFRAGNDGMRNQ